MPDILRLAIDIPLPADVWEERPKFLLDLAAPLREFRASVNTALGIDIGIKREIVSDAEDGGAKRGRKPRLPLEPLSTAPVAEPPAADAPRFGRKHDKAA